LTGCGLERETEDEKDGNTEVTEGRPQRAQRRENQEIKITQRRRERRVNAEKSPRLTIQS